MLCEICYTESNLQNFCNNNHNICIVCYLHLKKEECPYCRCEFKHRYRNSTHFIPITQIRIIREE